MRKKFTSLGVLSLFLMGGMAYAQISGVLKDSNGFPLEEAEVIVERTGASVMTDLDGTFNVDAQVGDTLKIIDASGEIRTIKVTSTKLGEIKIAPVKSDEISLATVNLIGGIKMDASQKVGAYDIIKKEDFELAPTASVDEVLNGRVAGLVFSTNSGDPGSANIITIRGVGSLVGTTNPLYVIDGIVVGKGSDNAGLMESWNPLAAIDPNAIENVSVLKDASATALYGARGANGVIVITTKKGKYNQKTRFNLSTDMAVQSVAFNEQNWMNANEYVQWVGLAYYNRADNQHASVEAASNWFAQSIKWDGTDTNWQKEIQRSQSVVKTYNFSATGGSENTSFRVGGSYYENLPLILNSKFDRLSVNAAIDHKVNDKFVLGFNGNFSNVARTSTSDGGAYRNPWNVRWTSPPVYKVYNEDGSYNQTNLGPGNDNFNPISILEKDKLSGNIQTYLSSINGELQFAKNFYLYSLFGVQYQNISEKEYWDPSGGDGFNNGGVVQTTSTSAFDWNWQNSVSYRNVIADRHDLQVFAGVEYQEHQYKLLYGTGSQLTEPKPYLNYTDATTRNTGEDFLKWAQISYFARLNYVLDTKYTFSGQLRHDSNSTLGKNDKSGLFWSVGGSWNVYKEGFLDNIFSSLNVRANYGEIGNIPYADNWGPQYNAFSTYGLSVYGDDSPTYYIDGAGDPDLGWEISKQWNVGADFGFFKDRLTFGIDVYNKRTVDAIMQANIAGSLGSPSSNYTNIGELSNKGVELTLTARPLTGEFKWSIYANAAYNKNRVEKLENPEDINDASSMRALAVGHEVGEYYTYNWAGVDKETGAGLFYVDETFTTTTTDRREAKRTFQGVSPFAKYTAGFKNDFFYKGIQLSIFFTGQFDYAVHNRWQNYVASDGNSINYTQTKDMLYDVWSPSNTNASNPKPIQGGNDYSILPSTRWMRKGDHIRLKEVKLAYTFNDLFKKSTGIDNLTMYVKGVNLWLWAFDDKLTFDPESNSNAYGGWEGKGLYDNTSPIMKSISLGISFDF
ncbi:SusC/RagA family TonB-linked outer membrane protein [Faecalibacter rhinopitheci]|uniref:SusC/RagA family TonB-linked outer membrane protein n=1 Tax=Faecalibacter rhinopitheci TaxID=2779678 RepID=A0A8J7FSV5_9FLAO|nr:SusC/RagA family TonB-linked outer membrane protein [Faecalibacter rhinopitheci]MBF0597072.1 SusC/RagA family TonB-linked outer membrane protein [Faecalibacter rhinopitheci]